MVAVASDVDDLALGDPVYALGRFDHDGAAADYTAVPTQLLAPKPRTLDHVQSAAVPLAALSAWQGLFDHGGRRRVSGRWSTASLAGSAASPSNSPAGAALT